MSAWKPIRHVGQTCMLLGDIPEPGTFEEHCGACTELVILRARCSSWCLNQVSAAISSSYMSTVVPSVFSLIVVRETLMLVSPHAYLAQPVQLSLCGGPLCPVV